MRVLIEIDIKAVTRAEKFNPETKKMELKLNKDGTAVYALHYVTKEMKQVGDIEIEEVAVKKINSLVEVKTGKRVMEVETFAMEKKIYYRAIAERKAL